VQAGKGLAANQIYAGVIVLVLRQRSFLKTDGMSYAMRLVPACHLEFCAFFRRTGAAERVFRAAATRVPGLRDHYG
jgi:hypothetical protein